MNFLLDTDICIYLINKRPPSVISRFKQYQPGDIGISVITVSELEYGVAKSIRLEENQQRLEAFLAPFELLPYTTETVRTYGAIQADLEKRGEVIGPLDMLIAAQALTEELTLVTNNEREFRRIPGLQIENWAIS
ncbi:MAG: type II toxin-antitoxin system VapC family toxin [Candidatus Electrothrix aestuarii]|uniref:Ribonuclease VapC n=1 Tax=Candidatus Electrothrix aestuarii TaxID=3062594 RepID=A0AAU8LR71_9BACT|nr:type II toxin-antitoxin system VapC family toxin [Candidatus Electrothrix aestuarii]